MTGERFSHFEVSFRLRSDDHAVFCAAASA